MIWGQDHADVCLCFPIFYSRNVEHDPAILLSSDMWKNILGLLACHRPEYGSCWHVPLSMSARGHNLSNILNSQESGLKVNQPASFAIRLNGAKGKIDAKVHSPSGAVEECHVSELEPGKWGVQSGGHPLPTHTSCREFCRRVSLERLGSCLKADRPSCSLCCCQALFVN